MKKLLSIFIVATLLLISATAFAANIIIIVTNNSTKAQYFAFTDSNGALLKEVTLQPSQKTQLTLTQTDIIVKAAPLLSTGRQVGAAPTAAMAAKQIYPLPGAPSKALGIGGAGSTTIQLTCFPGGCYGTSK